MLLCIVAHSTYFGLGMSEKNYWAWWAKNMELVRNHRRRRWFLFCFILNWNTIVLFSMNFLYFLFSTFSFCSFKNMWKKSFFNKTFSVSFGCVCACERICSTWKFHLMFHCSVFHHFFKLRLSFYLYLRMLYMCLHQLLFVLVKSVNFMQKYCIFITSIINSIVNNNIQQIWFYSTIFGFFLRQSIETFIWLLLGKCQ